MYIFTNRMQLASFPAPDMISLPLGGPQIQSESCWLPPRYVWHYCTLRVIVPMQVIDVVPRPRIWVGLLVASLLQTLALCLFGAMEASPRFQISVLWVLHLKCVVFNQKDLLPLEGNQEQQQQSVNLGSLLDNLDQQHKRGFLMPDVVVLIDGLWLLAGALTAQMKKISYYIYTLMQIFLVLGRQLRVRVLMTFPASIAVILYSCIYLPPLSAITALTYVSHVSSKITCTLLFRSLLLPNLLPWSPPAPLEPPILPPSSFMFSSSSSLSSLVLFLFVYSSLNPISDICMPMGVDLSTGAWDNLSVLKYPY